MKIVKCINNNIVTSLDGQNREIIVMGRGLGFGKKSGMSVDEKRIEKIFRLETVDENQKLLDIIRDISLDYIRVADRMIVLAKMTFGDKLKNTIYLSLIDHINCAIERYNNHVIFSNPLLWEIKQYYPEEFRVGLQCLDLLRDTLGIDFPEDEAGFIAFHFITAEYDTKMSVTHDIPKLIHAIMDIIEEYCGEKIDCETIHFERFVTHLKFFIARLLQSKQIPDNADDFLFQSMIRKQYEVYYQCALQIRTYVEKEYHVTISEEEVVYLTVHIRRIMM